MTKKAMTQNFSGSAVPTVRVIDPRWSAMLNTLGIHPTVAMRTTQDARPLTQAHTKIEVAAAKHRLPVQLLGYATLFDGTKLYPGAKTDWVMMNLSQDPMFYSNGNRLTLPEAAAKDVKRTVAAGINFDAIYIAHEIPAGQVWPGQPVPLELIAPPPSPQATRRLQAMEQRSIGLWDTVQSCLARMARIGKGAANTLASASMTAMALPLLALDPILFGIHFDDSWHFAGQPMAMWYYITHWRWPGQEDYQ